jgi:hypothetical protein
VFSGSTQVTILNFLLYIPQKLILGYVLWKKNREGRFQDHISKWLLTLCEILTSKLSQYVIRDIGRVSFLPYQEDKFKPSNSNLGISQIFS